MKGRGRTRDGWRVRGERVKVVRERESERGGV